MNVYKPYFITAATLMALAVAIGAFGAHGLKPYLGAYGTEIFKTGNFYHFIHGLGLFIVIFSSAYFNIPIFKFSFWAFVVGILLFSGSLYVLALRDHFAQIPAWLGAITPFGGLLFIAGWIGLGYFFSKKLK